jgi:hypothetical protein
VRGFHGLKADSEKKDARPDRSRLAQWRLLARRAMDAEPDGVWIDAPTAQNAVSEYKLSRMIGPAAALEAASDARERTVARLYALYERLLAHQNMLDFDDLIAHTVVLLQSDPAVRRRWQKRFERVLVDESGHRAAQACSSASLPRRRLAIPSGEDQTYAGAGRRYGGKSRSTRSARASDIFPFAQLPLRQGDHKASRRLIGTTSSGSASRGWRGAQGRYGVGRA